MTGTKPEDGTDDRRSNDRREADKPFEGEDKRQAERRSGEDRRKNKRG